MVEARDAVEARELTETPEDLTEAVEGRVDLAETLPGIFPLRSSVESIREKD